LEGGSDWGVIFVKKKMRMGRKFGGNITMNYSDRKLLRFGYLSVGVELSLLLPNWLINYQRNYNITTIKAVSATSGNSSSAPCVP
jgi:hypothetical protein